MGELGGIAGQMKKLSVFFMIVILGSVGLPLTNGFIGEFLLLLGVYTHSNGLRPLGALRLSSERLTCYVFTEMFSWVRLPVKKRKEEIQAGWKIGY
jgi:NADH:ubiquinone oxidoreductase subunit 4 (subunit M)